MHRKNVLQQKANISSATAANVVGVIIICLIQYYRHQEMLFYSFDGEWAFFQLSHSLRWADTILNTAINPYSMMGTLSIANGSLLPFAYFTLPPITAVHAKIICYTALTLQMFISMFILCKSLSFKDSNSLLAAWICINIVFPIYQRSSPLGNAFSAGPFHAHYCSLICLSFVCFRFIGSAKNSIGNMLLATAFLILSVLQVITTVASSPLSIPITVVGCVAICFFSKTKKEIAWKVCVAVFVVAVMFTGPLYSSLGGILYSARSFFNNEIIGGRVQLLATSVFFGKRIGTKIFILLAMIGTALMTRHKEHGVRIIGHTFSVYFVTLAALGVAYMTELYDQRSFPAPGYLEFMVAPFLAVPISYAILAACRTLTYLAEKAWPATPHMVFGTAARFLKTNKAIVLVLMFSGYITWQLFSTFQLKQYRLAPKIGSSPIVSTLQNKIGLTSGMNFRGRSVSLLPCGSFTDSETPDEWSFAEQCNWSFILPAPDVHNVHTLHHLWNYNIPTLDGYEQTLTAPFYVLFSRLSSATPWMINLSCISRFNLPLLTASGTRYVITAKAVRMEGMEPRALVVLRDGRLVDQGLVANAKEFAQRAQPGAKGFFLYELLNPNLGHYSPSTVRLAPTFSESIKILENKDFNYAREVVLHEPLPEGQALVPGTLESLQVIRGGLKVRAHSSGRSLLLLPFEFSRAWTWRPDGPDSGTVNLQRADLAMTALVFTGKIEGTLRFEFGPWAHPKARLEDLEDIKRMGIKDIPRRPLTGKARYL